MSLRSHKTVETIVCFHFLLVDGRIRILEVQKHADPTDPDMNPEHWLKLDLDLDTESGFDLDPNALKYGRPVPGDILRVGLPQGFADFLQLFPPLRL
jgi:hypothetical protein